METYLQDRIFCVHSGPNSEHEQMVGITSCIRPQAPGDPKVCSMVVEATDRVVSNGSFPTKPLRGIKNTSPSNIRLFLYSTLMKYAMPAPRSANMAETALHIGSQLVKEQLGSRTKRKTYALQLS